MKIKELIQLLQLCPDKEREIFTESLNGYYTTNIALDLDENNDVRLCEYSDKETAFHLNKEFAIANTENR